MSSYMYLRCEDHDPPILADDESGQHHYDLHRIRLERDELAAEVERLKLVHVGQARLAMLAVYLADVDGHEGTQAFYDAWVRAHDAALIESLADEWAADPDAWGDNDKDYRNELRDRARQIREGEA